LFKGNRVSQTGNGLAIKNLCPGNKKKKTKRNGGPRWGGGDWTVITGKGTNCKTRGIGKESLGIGEPTKKPVATFLKGKKKKTIPH